MKVRIAGHNVRLTPGTLERHMARLVCPYCNEKYHAEESVKHLNTRDCLAAQKALREVKP